MLPDAAGRDCPSRQGENAMDAVEGLIAKLRANPALAGKPFAVVFRLTAKPGQEDVVRRTMERILPLTRAEAGNITFDLHQDADDPRTFFLYERWRGVDDLADHLRQPYIREAFEVYGASAAGEGTAMFGTFLTGSQAET
jgi:quinol monooxygenase YgiN